MDDCPTPFSTDDDDQAEALCRQWHRQRDRHARGNRYFVFMISTMFSLICLTGNFFFFFHFLFFSYMKMVILRPGMKNND